MLVKLNKSIGFTLVELTMVLFIVALLLGGLLVPLSTRLEQGNRETTAATLNDIKEALLGYAVINGRLPCPDCPDGNAPCNAVAAADRNDGIGDWTGSAPDRVCATQVGNLPWVDLQVGEYDAWNRHFTYRVTAEFSRESQDGSPAPCGTPAVDVSFELCSAGDIQVFSTYVNPYVGTPTVASNVPAIVISHGADAYEPAQTNQQVENYDRNPVHPETGASILTAYNAASYTPNYFIYSDYSRDTSLDPAVRFDDIVMWISPNLLMNRMIISGRLP